MPHGHGQAVSKSDSLSPQAQVRYLVQTNPAPHRWPLQAMDLP